jgi:hypothetical protein
MPDRRQETKICNQAAWQKQGWKSFRFTLSGPERHALPALINEGCKKKGGVLQPPADAKTPPTKDIQKSKRYAQPENTLVGASR